MNAIPYEGRGEEDLDGYTDDQEFEEELSRRPRRNYFNRWSALLLAVILAGIGFYAGIRVEKNQLASSSTTGAASALSRFAGLGSSSTSGSSARSLFGGSGGGGFASRFGAGGLAGLAGGNDTIGTVSSVNGNTIYVTDTSGNTVKVKLSGSTKITKTESVSKGKVYPGDSVVIGGVKGSNGTVTATTLSDSGSRAATSGTSGASSSSSGASAVSSLFGSGGGG
jgi:hypothetical protein